jgi:hypothetical protein
MVSSATAMFALVAWLGVAQAADQLAKVPFEPRYPEGMIPEKLLENLRQHTRSTFGWQHGTLPEACKDATVEKGLKPQDITVLEFYYDDAKQP